MGRLLAGVSENRNAYKIVLVEYYEAQTLGRRTLYSGCVDGIKLAKD
jgi:hypothetical protein